MSFVEQEPDCCYCRICGNETEADFDLCELCAEEEEKKKKQQEPCKTCGGLGTVPHKGCCLSVSVSCPDCGEKEKDNQ